MREAVNQAVNLVCDSNTAPPRPPNTTVAKKHEDIEQDREIFEECEKSIIAIIDDSKLRAVKPLKEIISLSPQTRTKEVAYPDPTLPVHSHFFESHRIQVLKKVLRKMVRSEVKYHIKVIEHLTEVLDLIEE